MGVEVLVAVLGDHHLPERRRAAVDLECEQPAHQRPARDDEAQAQRRRDVLGERADVDHAVVAGHGPHGGRAAAVEGEVRVAVVLEDRHVVGLGEGQDLGAARRAHHRRRRVLHGRDGVDELRPHTLRLQVGQRLAEGCRRQPVTVDRHPDDLGAPALHARQRAAVGLLLDDDGVALGDQRAEHELQRRAGARGHRHLVGRHLDPRVRLQLAHKELAQRQIALVAALHVVGSEHAPLARDHRLGRRDEAGDRHAVAVVVAANKVVLREPRPLGRGGRQVGAQQRRVVERLGGHGIPLMDMWSGPDPGAPGRVTGRGGGPGAARTRRGWHACAGRATSALTRPR